MKELYNKYGAIFIAAIVLFLSYLIIKPYFLSILSASLIVYILYPVYLFLESKLKRGGLSALVMCLLVFLLIIFPSFYILKSLLREIPSLYVWLTGAIQNSRFLQDFILERIVSDFGINLDLTQLLQSFLSYLLKQIQSLMLSIPTKIINITIWMFLLYYLFKDGKELVSKIIHFLPFSKKDSTIIIRELKKMTDAVIYGQVVTAVIQSILATLAYVLLGIKAPLFWGVVTFIFSIIPMLGPAIAYVPLSIHLAVVSYASNDTFGIVKGVILLAFGFGIISSVDNVIKPLVISDKVRIHPGIVLLGVFGGLSVFGVIGVIIGPLILALFMTLLNLYEMKEEVISQIEHPGRRSK